MTRKVLVLALGSLLALPVFANNEIDAGNLPPEVATTMTREQVRSELMAAQRAGEVIANAELGTWEKEPAEFAGKTRAQVAAEAEEAFAVTEAGRADTAAERLGEAHKHL